MLVLKRHRGEVIMIGEAHVQVLQISEEWVELGISAPATWPIAREAIHVQDGTEDHARTNETQS